MALIPGARLGPYEILSLVGAGGMGEVYKARDTRLDRIVAIKILPEALAADPQFRERFDREARTISQLDHPHICALYDVGEQNGISFLVMQHLEGETLAERLERGAPPLNEALTNAIQIADALDRAHRAGIVHRDLKPGNIFLTKAGAKLLDFGLAKTRVPAIAGAGASMLPTTPRNLTGQGTILGTFQYMAPEQLEGQEADARTDIFAFGSMFYEMLTGRKAFAGKTQASVIGAIMQADPPSLAASQPLAPPALDRVVRKCLAKEPDDRWQSARDLHDELKWIDQEAGAAHAAVMPRRMPWTYAAWLTALVAVLGAIAVLVVASRRAAPDLSPLRLEVSTPPTSDLLSFALSPDGRQLVFVANTDSGPKLWLRPLDSATAQPLAGTEGASFPFWSPDSRAIAFFAGGRLKRIDLSGGTLQVLATAPVGRGGAWSRDGVILFSPNTSVGLWRVPATGGAAATVVTRLTPGQGSHRYPEFLPDGRHFVFFVALSAPDVQGVYLGSLDGLDTRRLMAADSAAMYVPAGYLLMTRQSVLVAVLFDASRGSVSGEAVTIAPNVGVDPNILRGAFSASATGLLAYRAGAGVGLRQLEWIDRTGKVVGTLGSPDQTNLRHPELSPDGKRVAVARTIGGNVDIWLIDIARGVPSRFTFDLGVDTHPVWTTDGSRIVFRSTRNGSLGDLFVKPASGARDEQGLFASAENKIPADTSPDGRLVLFVRSDPNGSSDLWALPLHPVSKPYPVVQTPFDEDMGQFSPDGRWLAYHSNESGRDEIYVQPFPGPGGKWQVSTGGGTQPRWRRDGKELFYVALDARLMAAAISVKPDGQTLEPGAPVALFPTHLGGGGFPKQEYAVAADGRRFLMGVVVGEASTSPITVVVNWTAGMKK